jgi:hypothetical protein
LDWNHRAKPWFNEGYDVFLSAACNAEWTLEEAKELACHKWPVATRSRHARRPCATLPSDSVRRWRYGAKSTTDDYRTLDVRRWAAHRAHAVQPRRFARLVHLPGGRLRAARGDPLRRRHLRLPALLIGSPTPVRARTLATAQQGALIDSARAWAGSPPGILNGEGGKPKWMRWRTFEGLAAEHDQLVRRSLQAAALKFGPLVSDFRFWVLSKKGQDH